VRNLLGAQLDDLDFEEPWLVVDAEVDGPVRFPPLHGVPSGVDLQRLSVMMCDPMRPATVVPGRGTHRRWEFMLLPGEDDEQMMRPDSVARLVGPWLEGVPHRIVRAATYRFHGLIAERWQAVAYAGDAAHQTRRSSVGHVPACATSQIFRSATRRFRRRARVIAGNPQPERDSRACRDSGGCGRSLAICVLDARRQHAMRRCKPMWAAR
jgi:3-(3-hydroxy-phenyl)propionate hydroxylase